MDSSGYLRAAGLNVELPREAIRSAENALSDVLKACDKAPLPKDVTALYSYRVPRMSRDGVCSIHDDLAPEPFDLKTRLGTPSERTTRNLMALSALVESTQQRTSTDWLGVYQRRTTPTGPALVKLAYRGSASRAEFPLTKAFAEKSNNSTVGLSGKARLLNDINVHVKQGGAYYQCDPSVQSEACLPLYDGGGEVIGIIDAECAKLGHFTPERLAWLVVFALEAPFFLPR